MRALAFGPGSAVLTCGVVTVVVIVYFRFHLVPAGLSSSRTPRAERSFRILSAAAKSRRRRAERAACFVEPLDDVGMRSPSRHGFEPRKEIAEPLERPFGAAETLPREVQLLPVMRRQEKVPDSRRPKPFGDDVGNRVRVPE